MGHRVERGHCAQLVEAAAATFTSQVVHKAVTDSVVELKFEYGSEECCSNSLPEESEDKVRLRYRQSKRIKTNKDTDSKGDNKMSALWRRS
jgi:hypothetical protein